MSDWNQTDTLFILGFLLMVAIFSTWEDAVDLAKDTWVVDMVTK